MSRHQLNRVDVLEMFFDSEYVHSADLSCWWTNVLQALWDSAGEHVPPEQIRPLMNAFADRVRQLELPAPSQSQQSR